MKSLENRIIKTFNSYNKKQNSYKTKFYFQARKNGIEVKTFCGRKIFLPSRISRELLYFIGVVVGDGSLPIKFNDRGKRNYAIVIEKANKNFIFNVLRPLVEDLFRIKWGITQTKKINREDKWALYLYSKPLYFYLTKIFDFPEGKKSHIIRMPRIIRTLESHERIPFIAGVMDTDWGVCGKSGFGTHCASEKLLEDIRNVLSKLVNIEPKITKYVQEDKYASFQMIIPKSQKQKVFNLFKQYFPLRNQKRIIALNAEVA